MCKILILLFLPLSLLEVTAWKNPKAGDTALCPPLEDNSVRVDIRILRQNQGAISISNDFQNRSSSPWDYNITRDPNRFPSEIVEAQCRHSGCINAEGQEDSSMNSVPEPQGCSRTFRLEKVRVTVGCTCVTPIVRYVRA
uniref:Interleukin-17F n=1 Tax=Panthera tigris altaica TaxID=74533 RepID=A0A8C9M831_PANTA